MVFSDAAAHEQRFHQCDAIRSCIFSCSFLALLLGRFRRRRRHRFALGIGNLGSNQGSHTGSRSLRNAATAQNLCRCQGIAANGECNKKLHHNCIHCAVGSAATSSCLPRAAMTGLGPELIGPSFHGRLKLRFKVRSTRLGRLKSQRKKFRGSRRVRVSVHDDSMRAILIAVSSWQGVKRRRELQIGTADGLGVDCRALGAVRPVSRAYSAVSVEKRASRLR